MRFRIVLLFFVMVLSFSIYAEKVKIVDTPMCITCGAERGYIINVSADKVVTFVCINNHVNTGFTEDEYDQAKTIAESYVEKVAESNDENENDDRKEESGEDKESDEGEESEENSEYNSSDIVESEEIYDNSKNVNNNKSNDDEEDGDDAGYEYIDGDYYYYDANGLKRKKIIKNDNTELYDDEKENDSQIIATMSIATISEVVIDEITSEEVGGKVEHVYYENVMNFKYDLDGEKVKHKILVNNKMVYAKNALVIAVLTDEKGNWIQKKVRYFNEDETMSIGWHLIDGNWYFMNNDPLDIEFGIAYVGKKIIDGIEYKFDEYGRLLQ